MTFEEFYEKYYNIVLGYIMKRVCDMPLSEDLTMESFLSAYKSFADFDRSKADYGTWLFVIVNNRLKNYYRDNRKQDELDKYVVKLDGADEVEEACTVQELRNELFEALQKLNETQRTIMIYKFFREKRAPEIARIMGLSSGSVRVQISRAMKKLNEILQEKGLCPEDYYG